jgi:hypothetical protein
VTEEIDDGWWIGTVQGTGRSGMFPSNYTEKINPIPVIPPNPRIPAQRANSFNSERSRASSQPVSAPVPMFQPNKRAVTDTKGACGQCT